MNEEELAKYKEAGNASLNPVKFIAIDPGKRNGVCGYDERFYLQFMIPLDETELLPFLKQFNHLEKVIMESFSLFPNKAKEQIYSDMLTSRVIGRVEHWCSVEQVDLVMQPPSIKPVGYKWIGKRPFPKGHPMRDPLDAHVHGMYWAVKNRRVDAATLIKAKEIKDG